MCNRVGEVACRIQVRGWPFRVCFRRLAPGSLEIKVRNCLFAAFVACSGMYIGKRLALHCSWLVACPKK